MLLFILMNAESARSFDRIAVSSLFAEAVAPECGAAKSCHADVPFLNSMSSGVHPGRQGRTAMKRTRNAAPRAFDFRARHVLNRPWLIQSKRGDIE
jgi:hypothetical protein